MHASAYWLIPRLQSASVGAEVSAQGYTEGASVSQLLRVVVGRIQLFRDPRNSGLFGLLGRSLSQFLATRAPARAAQSMASVFHHSKEVKASETEAGIFLHPNSRCSCLFLRSISLD